MSIDDYHARFFPRAIYEAADDLVESLGFQGALDHIAREIDALGTGAGMGIRFDQLVEMEYHIHDNY